MPLPVAVPVRVNALTFDGSISGRRIFDNFKPIQVQISEEKDKQFHCSCFIRTPDSENTYPE